MIFLTRGSVFTWLFFRENMVIAGFPGGVRVTICAFIDGGYQTLKHQGCTGGNFNIRLGQGCTVGSHPEKARRIGVQVGSSRLSVQV
jgi:hypothetical protein